MSSKTYRSLVPNGCLLLFATVVTLAPERAIMAAPGTKATAVITVSGEFSPDKPVHLKLRSGNARAQYDVYRHSQTPLLHCPELWIKVTATWKGKKTTKTFSAQTLPNGVLPHIRVLVRYDSQAKRISLHRQ